MEPSRHNRVTQAKVARQSWWRPRDPVFLLVLACFLLSGFAALLYETVWTRQFAFVFGTVVLIAEALN